MSESLIFVTMLRTNYRCCSLTQFVDTDRKKNLSSSVVLPTAPVKSIWNPNTFSHTLNCV